MTNEGAHGEEHGSKRRRSRHHGDHGGGSHEEHEGAPEWLISFADNVTLMMGFFVILLAMNLKEPTTGGIGGKDENAGGAPSTDLPEGEPSPGMLDVALAIRAAFNNPVDPHSEDPADLLLVRRLLERMGPSQAATDGPRGRDHDVQSIKPTDFYALCGKVEFANQSVELSAEARAAVIDIAQTIAGHTVIIEVRGHASAAEGMQDREHGARLAFERTMVVAKLMSEYGVDWWHMRLTSSGHHDRLKPFPFNHHEDTANARVEIILTEDVAPSQVPTNPDEVSR